MSMNALHMAGRIAHLHLHFKISVCWQSASPAQKGLGPAMRSDLCPDERATKHFSKTNTGPRQHPDEIACESRGR